MNIPKVIWQTYKTRDVPATAQACMKSWKQTHPDWRHEFYDDAEITDFVRENVSDEVFNFFLALPLGVMKADFWRYAVLLKHGGIYADIDTYCRVQSGLWANGNKGLVIGVEDTKEYFCQWVIAAKPNHPVLRRALELIIERVRDGIDVGHPEFVHYYTGPALWTDAIRDYLAIEDTTVSLGENTDCECASKSLSAQKIFESQALWQNKDITIHHMTIFSGAAVGHHFASLRWGDQPAYASWRQELTTLLSDLS